MLVESHYDRHAGPPHAPRLITGTPCAPELRRSLPMRQDRSPAHAIFRRRISNVMVGNYQIANACVGICPMLDLCSAPVAWDIEETKRRLKHAATEEFAAGGLDGTTM